MEICVEYFDLHQVKGSLENSVVLVIFQPHLTMQPRPYLLAFKTCFQPFGWIPSRTDRPVSRPQYVQEKTNSETRPHKHPRPAGNKPWGYTKEGDCIELHLQLRNCLRKFVMYWKHQFSDVFL